MYIISNILIHNVIALIWKRDLVEPTQISKDHSNSPCHYHDIVHVELVLTKII